MCCMSRRFMLENFVLDKHVRYIITTYLVVIWALTGVFMKKQDAVISIVNSNFIGEELLHVLLHNSTNIAWTVNDLLTVTGFPTSMHTLILPSDIYLSTIDGLLGVACTLFGGRMFLVIWRHIKFPFYEDINVDNMSPMEVAEKQKKIFM